MNLAANAPGKNPGINRLVGTEGSMGAMLGLDAKWAARAVAQGGNYGEIYERNVGPNTPSRDWTWFEQLVEQRWCSLRCSNSLISTN